LTKFKTIFFEKLKIIYYLGGGALITLSACQKELAPNTTTTKPFAKTAMEFENQAYANLAKLDRAAIYDFAEAFRTDLAQNTKTTSEEYELGEAFLGLEGLVNNDFWTYWADFESQVIQESTFHLPYNLVDEVRYVSFTDFSDSYAELYNQVYSLLDSTNQQFLLLDLSIADLDDNNGVATIICNAITADTEPYAPSGLFLTPAGAVTAVKGVTGACNPNNDAVVDAADYLRVYSNMTAPWRSLNCSNGIYILPRMFLNTTKENENIIFMPYAPGTNTNTWSDVVANYWHSNTNECLGGTDPGDWYALYNKMDNLVDYGLVRIANYYQVSLPSNNLMLHHTDYHSHPFNQGFFYNPSISSSMYHGGVFYYAVIGCQ